MQTDDCFLIEPKNVNDQISDIEIQLIHKESRRIIMSMNSNYMW